jgi:hypothetical protein
MEIIQIIQVILTSALVIITAWYAYITNRILKSSEKALKEQLRPYIITHIVSIDHWLQLSIKNIGKRPALNIDIEFNPHLDVIDKLVANTNEITTHKPLLKQTFIPPDFEINTTLMYTPNFVTNPELTRIFEITITYKDSSDKEYSDNYILDLSAYIYDKKTFEFSHTYYLNEIIKELKGIKEQIKRRIF